MLGLEAAADAGGLTSFSRKTEGRKQQKRDTNKTRQADIQMTWEKRQVA